MNGFRGWLGRGRSWWGPGGFALATMTLGGCLSARAVERNYFVMHGEPVERASDVYPVDGLVRVRDMDTDSVYEKFQIVVRRSPYQLRYSEQNVWAVKPNQMVSDLVAQALEEGGAFTDVTRQLLDARPTYTMSGKLRAVELYDSGDVWFAHLSVHLHLTRFGDGTSLWAFEFDQRKEVDSRSFAHGVRALSELLHQAIRRAIQQIQRIDAPLARRTRPWPHVGPGAVDEIPASSSAPALLFVPESTGPSGPPTDVSTSTVSAAISRN